MTGFQIPGDGTGFNEVTFGRAPRPRFETDINN